MGDKFECFDWGDLDLHQTYCQQNNFRFVSFVGQCDSNYLVYHQTLQKYYFYYFNSLL